MKRVRETLEAMAGPLARAETVDLGAPLPRPQDFLLAAELDNLSRFTSMKRRRQWLGGRLAAKRAAAGLLGCGVMDLAVIARKDGSPRLVRSGGDKGPEPQETPEEKISISHSHELAAALAAAGPCGIDVELMGPRPARLAERFARAAESALVTRQAGRDPGHTMLWCAKEALRKAIRPLPGFFDLRLRAVEQEEYGYLMVFSTPAGEARCPASAACGYGLALFIAPGAR